MATHQTEQLRLSFATPLLAALIQGEANNNAVILMLMAGRTSDTFDSVRESLTSCNTPIEIVCAALAYADLLIEENSKG